MSKIKVNEIDKRNGSTLTLGGSGTAVTLACGATQTGFGRTGTVDWQTSSIKTATFTAANGEGYFADTSSGGFTMNLPAGTAGNIVSVVDYTNTFNNNGLTITPNGSQKIGGVANSITLTTIGQSVTFVYVDDTEGWKNVQDSTSNVTGQTFITATGGTITTVCTNFKVHTFTGPGTFCVSQVATTAADNIVDYLVVAGGGGAGSFNGGAGGGGGFRYYANTTNNPQTCAPGSPLNNFPSGTAITVTSTAFPITVGSGGTTSPQNPGSQGSSSVFSTITSAGGGFGGGGPAGAVVGGNGGSGGGSGGSAPTCSFSSAGTGNTPPVNPPQGKNGGQGKGGAGGGALVAAGGPGPAAGGAGAGVKGFGTSGESGPNSSRYFSGGGGGGKGGCAPAAQQGGIGGAGNNYYTDCGATIAGTANTGGGGGGDGGTGGSGVVIIRYKFQ